MSNYINGNILDVKNSIIFQVVNCQGIMGGGLAFSIIKKWPEVYSGYIDKIRFYKKDYESAYGAFHTSFLLGEINYTKVSDDNIVLNLFAQDNIGTKNRQLCYKSFLECLHKFETQKEFFSDLQNKKLCFPYKIGCGLAGGDWNIVEKLIIKRFPDCLIYKI